jgi:hypothetical protein
MRSSAITGEAKAIWPERSTDHDSVSAAAASSSAESPVRCSLFWYSAHSGCTAPPRRSSSNETVVSAESSSDRLARS